MQERSGTWCQNITNICLQYGIQKPSALINSIPPPKENFKQNIESRIISFHENEQRKKAKTIKRLKYFNLSLLGLSARSHPALSNLNSVNDVKRSRVHIKMLLGDYYTYEIKSVQSGGDPFCVLCVRNKNEEHIENLHHILLSCENYSVVRNNYLEKYKNILISSNIHFDEMYKNKEEFCQFILDPTSMNLKKRININDPILPEIFKISRNLCHTINNKRLEDLGCRRYQK